MSTAKASIVGYLPADRPRLGALLSLGFQQVLTMFPATVLVAILTKFDISTTLLASGLGTIVALFVTGRQIPLYYGSSFSYIAVVISTMNIVAKDCFTDATMSYCRDGVSVVQVGIMGTAIVEILVGLLIMRIGKEGLDKVLPAVITGSVAIVIGIALSYTAITMANGSATVGGAPKEVLDKFAPEAWRFWVVSLLTLLATIIFSVYLQGKGLLGMLPVLLGAIFGYLISIPFGLIQFGAVATPDKLQWIKYFNDVITTPVLQLPRVTLPAFGSGQAWGAFLSIALIAIATIPESTAHLYQMSLYIDQLAKELGRAPLEIKKLIGLNLVADGSDDLVVGFLGGCAGTNYGENNSLMAITRCYSVPVLICAGVIAILLGFVGTLSALVGTLPVAVTGGLSIYLFGVIGMQGIALIQSEKVNLFEPRQLAVGAIILVTGIGGAIGLPNGMYPFPIPALFPNGIPAIVFSAIVGILVNLIFLLLPPRLFGVQDRENINL